MELAVPLADFVSLVAAVGALALALHGRLRPLPRDTWLLLLGALGLICFYSLSNTLEWSGLTGVLDRFEDQAEMLLPVQLWAVFYTALRAQQADDLRRRQEELAALLAAADNVAFLLLDLSGPRPTVTDGSAGAARLFARERAELVGQPVERLLREEDRPRLTGLLADLREGVDIPEVEFELLGADGRRRPALAAVRALAGRSDEVLLVAVDLTERKRREQEQLQLQERVLQAQRLESLGVMAGGIAHDFNNLLLAIMGNADLAAQQAGSEGIQRNLQAILTASRRASDLTGQMLAYAGKGRLATQPVELAAVVREMAEMLHATLPRAISVSLELAEDLPAFEADPTQVRQVVLNLITNATEAIGERPGTIALRTGRLELGPGDLYAYQPAGGLQPGSFAMLEVSDDGPGMPPEVQRRIFEPFFSTKFTGRGLGLAAVLGIARGHCGGLRVTSAPGAGAALRVVFPLAAPSASSSASGLAGPAGP